MNKYVLKILTGYLLIIISGVTLFSLPVFYKTTLPPLIDRFFVVISAVTVTGLNPIDLSILSTWGIGLLLLLLQIGGVGIMAFWAVIVYFLRKDMPYRQHLLLQTEYNYNSFFKLSDLAKIIIFVTLGSQIIGATFLYFRFLTYYESIDAFKYAVFYSITGFTNAGFSIFPDSLTSFHQDYFITVPIMILIFLGSIGFPIFLDLYYKFFHKNRLTLHTVITLKISLILVFVFAGLIYFTNGGISIGDSFFQSVSARNGGLNTVEIASLNQATIILLMLAMFIGNGSLSCGGGIRVTTFYTILITIISYIRTPGIITTHNREIPLFDAIKAFSIASFFIILMFVSSVIIACIEPFSFLEILFEVTSGLTTTGYSLGITSELSAFSKFILMINMLIGRIGVATLLLSFIKPKNIRIRHPQENIILT